MLVKILAVAVVSVLAYAAFEYVYFGPTIISLSGSSLVIENNRVKVDFALGGASSFGGVLIATEEGQGGGVQKSLDYFDESGAAEFLRTQQPGHCSAEFYDAHARHKELIPATPAVRAALAALDFSDHDDTASWRRFTVNGRCVSHLKSLTINGQPAGGPSELDGICMTMVVTDISVQDKPIQAF